MDEIIKVAWGLMTKHREREDGGRGPKGTVPSEILEDRRDPLLRWGNVRLVFGCKKKSNRKGKNAESE